MKTIFLSLFMLVNVNLLLAQYTGYQDFESKNNNYFLLNKEIMEKINSNGSKNIKISNFHSPDSNNLILDATIGDVGAGYSWQSIVQVTKNGNDYEIKKFKTPKYYADYFIEENTLFCIDDEVKKGELIFNIATITDGETSDSKVLVKQNVGKGCKIEQINAVSKNNFHYLIFSITENKQHKIYFYTFDSSFSLINKKEIISSVYNFSVVEIKNGVKIFTKDDNSSVGKLYTLNEKGELTENGEVLGLTGLTERLQYFSKNNETFLLSSEVNEDESVTQTLIQIFPKFEEISKTKVPKDVIYEGYYKKSSSELMKKFSLMMKSYTVTENLIDEDGNVYLFDYRFGFMSGSNGGYDVVRGDIFVTKINKNNEILLNKLIKKAHAGYIIFPEITISNEIVSFEDYDSGKTYKKGVYENDFKRTTGGLKGVFVNYTLDTKTGEIQRQVKE